MKKLIRHRIEFNDAGDCSDAHLQRATQRIRILSWATFALDGSRTAISSLENEDGSSWAAIVPRRKTSAGPQVIKLCWANGRPMPCPIPKIIQAWYRASEQS